MGANFVLYLFGLVISLVFFSIGPALWTVFFMSWTKDDREVYNGRYKKIDYEDKISIIKMNIEDNLKKGINIFEVERAEGFYLISEGFHIYEDGGIQRDNESENESDYNYAIRPYVYPNAKIKGKRDPRIMSAVYDEWYPTQVKKYQNKIIDNHIGLQVSTAQNSNKDMENDHVCYMDGYLAEPLELTKKPTDLNLESMENMEYTDIYSNDMVYISKNGKGTKYHTISSCGNSVDMVEISKIEAENQGYNPCKRCCNFI